MSSPRIAKSRILGLDYGMKRIGVALSDESKILASPYKTLEAAKKVERTVEIVLALIGEIERERGCKIEEVVIGLPLRMNGKQSLLADEVNAFIAVFRQLSSITINSWDERLTTVQAERSMLEGSLTRKRRSQSIDVATATIILQSYLDSKGNTLFYPTT